APRPPSARWAATLRFVDRTRAAPDRSYPLTGVASTKSTTTRASCSPRSSCRKCPAPSIVVCGRPLAPGMSLCRTRSPPAVIGSESLNAVRNGFSHRWSTSHARRFASDAGASGLVGTSLGNWRAPPPPGASAGGGAVGGDDLGGEVGRAAAVHDPADGERLGLLRELLPREEGVARVPVTCGQEGVAGDDAREPVLLLGCQPEPDEAAPVLAEERD